MPFEGSNVVNIVNGTHGLVAASTRLIYVGSEDPEDPQDLLMDKNVSTEALTTKTLPQFSVEIPLEVLPQTLHDTILWARTLDERYVWIDSMCMMQDSKEDWDREASQMASIYGNATMTIVSASSSAYGGLSDRRNSLRNSAACISSQKSASKPPVYILPNGQRGKVSVQPAVDTRAWCYQEDVLSSRLVKLSQSSVQWQCVGDKNCNPANRAQCLGQLAKHPPLSLTYGKDKLIAFYGIGCDKADRGYLAGFLKKDLWMSLLWCRDENITRQRPGRRYREYVAPSWSWASVDATVLFHEANARRWRNPQLESTPMDPELLHAEIEQASYFNTGAVKSGIVVISACSAVTRTASVQPFLFHAVQGAHTYGRRNLVDPLTQDALGLVVFDVATEAKDGMLLLCVLLQTAALGLWEENGTTGLGLALQILAKSASGQRVSVLSFRRVVNKELLCSFSFPDLEIWSPGADKAIPFVVSRSSPNLQLIFSDAGADSASYTYDWEMIADSGPVSYSQGGMGCFWNATTGTQVVTFRLGVFTPNAFPVGFKGKIQWTIGNGTSSSQTFSTPIEFYVLPDNLPKFISDGLPVKLLRILLLSVPSVPQNTPYDWVAFVTNFLRTHNFRYETIGGPYNYCDYPDHGVNNIKTTCCLDRWMEHFKSMEGLVPGLAPQFERRVNCYDLATLAQVMIALGVDSKVAQLRMKFLQPFGYINKTSLIGFPAPEQETNNPFFAEAALGWNPNPIAEATDTLIRSKFQNHAFLTINTGAGEVAIDATCGPHNGTLTLQQYVDQAIDHTVTDPQDSTYRSGTISDVRDGPGVTDIQSLVDLPEFPFSPSTVGHPNEGIVQAMFSGADRMELPAGALGPPTYTINGTSLNLHWTYQLESEDTVSTIEMVFISSAGKLENLEYLHTSIDWHTSKPDALQLQSIYSRKRPIPMTAIGKAP
ncbi:hypothetical protein LSUE1_G008584 [Lachnellula suecica]|uniref:Heterokaryon incompatibility domain-containing protein n=1 Tax=Lachnellula suecica TaxID=602035 RepID=A0A8T9C2Q9_9HELO|nr:hypothetical protein LSUE1_G008584 [Lachnellula suecica]